MLRVILAPMCTYCMLMQGWWLVVAAVIFTVAAMTDSYDGYLARKYNLTTELGNFLDPLADKLLMGCVFYAFWRLQLIGIWFLAVVFGRDLFITGLRIILVKTGMPLQTSRIGKWKTCLQIVVVFVAFITGFIREFSTAVEALKIAKMSLGVALVVVAAITIYSAVEYVVNNWHVLAVLSKNFGVLHRRNLMLHVARFIATLGSLGYVVKAPGTVASLLTVGVLWLLPEMAVYTSIAALTVVAGIGLVAAHVLAAYEGLGDPGHIIIDEVVGMWLVLVFIPKTIVAYTLAFVLFRLFDIAKIPPVNYAESLFEGGLGIMFDDIVAGLCALAGAQVILLFL